MIAIKQSDIETVVALSKQIPEFHSPYEAADYLKRLEGVPHLILVAFDSEKAVGFKVGYEREKGSFYSWMGAILPEYRRQGIAQQLADYQELWAKEQGYPSIIFKTRNRLKAMLTFAINNGFNITRVEERENIGEYRIWLKKDLI